LVERIKITPSNITTKDASGNITFNTDNFYLKKSTDGTFKIGEYSRIPILIGEVYGSGYQEIYDDDAHGYQFIKDISWNGSWLTSTNSIGFLPEFKNFVMVPQFYDYVNYGLNGYYAIDVNTDGYTPIYLNSVRVGYGYWYIQSYFSVNSEPVQYVIAFYGTTDASAGAGPGTVTIGASNAITSTAWEGSNWDSYTTNNPQRPNLGYYKIYISVPSKSLSLKVTP
jgi:hypothetical protein